MSLVPSYQPSWATILSLWYPDIFSGENYLANLVALAVAFPGSPNTLLTILPSRPVLVAAGAIFLAALALAPVFWHTIGVSPASNWNRLGKVLVFPSKIHHARGYPKKHSFKYPYLVVGIPVGFRGTAGRLVAVDTQRHGLGRRLWWPFSLLFQSAWFTVDADDYLSRGRTSDWGLRGKLDDYLRSQDIDPAQYPHAYLVTAAKFLGYHFNPVSFWYLYDSSKELTAMILEVNNTFDERRMYFLTRSKSYDKEFIKLFQTWPKSFHVSPFNPPHEFIYRLNTNDPLVPALKSIHGRLDITIKLCPPTFDEDYPHPAYHIYRQRPNARPLPRLKAVLSSEPGDAIDPTTTTAAQDLRFLFLRGWWFVGLLTFPRICFQAALLWAKRLHVYTRPEPLAGTIPRRPTSTEKGLERVFRWWLHFLVASSTRRLSGATPALEVRYRPPPGIDVDEADGEAGEIVYLTPAAEALLAAGSAVQSVELKVLTPQFYTNLLLHHPRNNPRWALAWECVFGKTLAVSRPVLLG